MIDYINSLEDLKRAAAHPYRSGEYLNDGTNVFEVSIMDSDNEALIQSYEEPNQLFYMINWDDENLYTEEGVKIPPVYGTEELTLDGKINELYDSIVEGRLTSKQTAFILLKEYREQAKQFRDTKQYVLIVDALRDTQELAEGL